MIIFVTGRSGSGKSTFSKILAKKLGCKYVDVDDIGHSVYQDKSVMMQVCKLFGDKIFDEDGTFNRKKLGAIIFKEPHSQRTEEFNNITWAYMEKQLENLIKQDNVVVDFMLFPTTKFWQQKNFKILVKATDDEMRFKKLLARDGVSAEYLKLRDKAGISYDASKFDYVFENTYNQQKLHSAINQVCNKIENGIKLKN